MPNKPSLPRVIDSSQLVTFRACPRKFLHSYVNNRTLGREDSVPLVAGGAFAAGLEEYRLAHYVDGNSPALCLERAMLAASLSWGDANPFPPDRNAEHLTAARSLPRIFGAIEGYFKEYDPRFDRLQPIVQERDGAASFEYSFVFPLDDPMFPEHPDGGPFLYSGRADTLGTYSRIPVFSDEKTTGAMGRTWAEQWNLRNQFLGYRWALSKLGRPEAACLVRGICILKESFKYVESLVHIPSHLVDAFEASLVHSLQLMIHYHETGYWPQDFGDACTSFGGCMFKSVCLAPARVQPIVLAHNYNARTWDPLERKPRPALLDYWRDAA